MFRKIIFIIVALIAGGAGGLFAPRLVAIRWPNAPFLPPRNQTVIVNKTEQIITGEKEIFSKAYRKNISALVSVKSFKDTALLTSGFGFVVGADGRVVTRREVVAQGATSIIVGMQLKEISARVVKVSEPYGLVLLQAEISNLPVVSFVEDVQAIMGATAFLPGVRNGAEGPVPFVNVGSIKSVDGALLDTTIKEEFRLATGAPLVLLDGTVAGISATNSAGYVFAVSADAIRQFLRE